MKAADLKPGDQVLYRDLDEIQWGPWTVSDVSTRDGDRASRGFDRVCSRPQAACQGGGRTGSGVEPNQRTENEDRIPR